MSVTGSSESSVGLATHLPTCQDAPTDADIMGEQVRRHRGPCNANFTAKRRTIGGPAAPLPLIGHFPVGQPRMDDERWLSSLAAAQQPQGNAYNAHATSAHHTAALETLLRSASNAAAAGSAGHAQGHAQHSGSNALFQSAMQPGSASYLDGLAAGVSGISAASLIVLCTAMSQPIPAVLGAALVGSLLGFLYYNYSPATIFMGDGGSYFLGFILASLCIVGPQHIDSPFASLLPLLVLAVPLGDMLSVIAIRLYRKKSPFNADRLHLHHRLLDKDFSQKAAVWMLYVLTFITSAIALAVAGLIDGLGLLLILTLTIVVLLSWARRQTSTHSALVATGE